MAVVVVVVVVSVLTFWFGCWSVNPAESGRPHVASRPSEASGAETSSLEASSLTSEEHKKWSDAYY